MTSLECDTAMTAFRRDGYAVLRGVVSSGIIDAFRAATEPFFKDPFRSDLIAAQRWGAWMDAYTREDELALRLGLAPTLLAFCRALFGDEPVRMNGFLYKHGSALGAHTDLIWHREHPVTGQCRAWLALENVHPDAGPLFLLPGAHRTYAACYAAIAERRPHLEGKLRALRGTAAPLAAWRAVIREANEAYREVLLARHDLEADRAVPELRKGDMVVFDKRLAHGGLPVTDPERTRWCLIQDFRARSARTYEISRYFSPALEDLRPETAVAIPIQATPHGLVGGAAEPAFDAARAFAG